MYVGAITAVHKVLSVNQIGIQGLFQDTLEEAEARLRLIMMKKFPPEERWEKHKCIVLSKEVFPREDVGAALKEVLGE